MTTASFGPQFIRETRLLGYLYPAAVVLGICSAFISTHTNLKIVTMEPRSVAAPTSLAMPLPPERTIWEFGYPEPTVEPVKEPIGNVIAQRSPPRVTPVSNSFFGQYDIVGHRALVGYPKVFSVPYSKQPLTGLAFQTAWSWQANRDWSYSTWWAETMLEDHELSGSMFTFDPPTTDVFYWSGTNVPTSVCGKRFITVLGQFGPSVKSCSLPFYLVDSKYGSVVHSAAKWMIVPSAVYP
jgi:hypothetical protein